MKLIECVPNLSEGRRPEVVAALARAVSGTPDVLLLDTSSDPDHNRTVLTLVGSPEGLKEAVLRLYEAALAQIDLRTHRGEHPRAGAVDVVPFIPLRGARLEDCVHLARDVGEAVGRRFAVPVFLYGEAATAASRKGLARIRAGGFEGMAAKMTRPGWAPDFGPGRPHPSAGVSAIGARSFLIAYNIQLDTPDVGVAQAVAGAVRARSGGLMNVQALGVRLASRNRVQVSMNLLDYEKTPLHRVQELVRIEAARWGARIISSEVVGLIPQAALLEAAAHYLQIENWRPELVLENVLQQKQGGDGEAAR